MLHLGSVLIVPNDTAILSGLEATLYSRFYYRIRWCCSSTISTNITSTSVGVLDPNDMTLGLTGVSFHLMLEQ